MSADKKRINWIDYAKLFGIYLVVLGHASIPDSIKNPIYTFHMPLFFFISGYLFSFEKHPIYKKFALQRAKQLLVPYLTFNVITYIIWVAVGRKFGIDENSHIKAYEPILGIFYGNGAYLTHNNVLWFLPCLFVVENVFYLVFKHKSLMISIGIIVLFLLGGFAYYKLGSAHLPWGVDTALVAMVFYWFANTFKKSINQLFNISVLYQILIWAPSLILFILYSPLNGRVDMMGYAFGNYAMFFVLAALGVFVLIVFANIAGTFLGYIKSVEYLSMNTLIILAFHNLAFTFIKGITFFVFKYPLSIYDNTLFINLLLSLISILVLIPVMIIFNRYLSILIGRSSKRKPSL